jgi:MarR family transcriptional regulator, transcriptional regulator for hemolysin
MKNNKLPLGMVIVPMINEMFRALKRRTSKETDVKLTIEQFGFLFAIEQKKDDVIQKEMAEIMGKDQSSILRTVDSLAKKELIRRVVDPNDRRKNFLMVTKRGEQVIEQYLKIELQLNEELTEGLSSSELSSFFKVIDHIKNKAKTL